MIGRDQDWLKLETAYTQLRTGGVILISGEAGVGKSRLLHAFAADQNAYVLSGRCYSGMQLFAYHPLVEALRPALCYPTITESAISPVWLAEAERILPELRTIFPDLRASSEMEPTRGQLRLFEALLQILVGLAAKIDVILCLDDLHLADESTVKWLQYVAPRLRASHISILATYCPQDPDLVTTLKCSLLRIGLMTEIKLEPLSVQDVTQLLQFAQRLDPDTEGLHTAMLARHIHGITEGNTFFVLELIRELLAQGRIATLPKQLHVPETVQVTISRRLEQISAVARQVLEAAAVLYPHLDFQLIRQTSGRDETEVNDGLSELVCHQFLRDSAKGLTFQHALVQQTIYERLPIWRRHLLRQRAAEALVRRRCVNH